MDGIMNKAKGMMNKSGSGTTGTTGTTSNTGAGQDYGDKGLAAAQKKMGMQSNAETNERITDGARGMFEKSSGKKVPEKFSN